jgi:hypothetical protein
VRAVQPDPLLPRELQFHLADSLLGPFTVVDPARPTPPENLMTLDGTLYVDPSGQPWMVYAHE